MFENDYVRVLDTHILPGEQTQVHTHRYPCTLYVQSSSDFVRYDPDGRMMVDSRMHPHAPSVGTALWSEPLIPHSLRNVGDKNLHVISVEPKKKKPPMEFRHHCHHDYPRHKEADERQSNRAGR